MKSRRILGWLGVLTLFAYLPARPDRQAAAFPELKGPYLGQKTPGMTAEVFAPNIVSSEFMDSVPVFSPDGKEIYWSRIVGQGRAEIVFSRLESGRWSTPKPVSFARPDLLDVAPSISADGQKMAFLSRRPLNGKLPSPAFFFIWTATRTGREWSAAAPLGPAINAYDSDISAVLAGDGTLYFTGRRPNKAGKIISNIFFSGMENGEYGQAEKLAAPFNTDDGAMLTYVASDQSYIICTSTRNGGFGQTDLYISFRQKDGVWGPSVNMGQAVNSPGYEHFASVSPDGKYFFFSSDRGGNMDVYWVDAKILAELKKRIPADFP
jgi:hypothetical protein